MKFTRSKLSVHCALRFYHVSLVLKQCIFPPEVKVNEIFENKSFVNDHAFQDEKHSTLFNAL